MLPVRRLSWKRFLLVAAVSSLVGPSPAVAQEGAGPSPDFLNERGARARLLLLGSFHFAYPDLDVQKSSNRVDVLSPERQREIEEMVDRLAAYRPTRIAVEVTPDRQAALDSLYREYVAGRWPLRAAEQYQLGFRLAKRLGHERVYAVDTERNQLLIDLSMERLAPRQEELRATDREWQERFRALFSYEDSLSAARGESLRETFLRMNSPGSLRRSHMAYHVGFFKFDGEEGGYDGADFVSGWYNRNLRIFRNLQRITTGPEERLLVVVGSGHVPILRFVAEHSPEYELVEVERYLGGERPSASGPAR